MGNIDKAKILLKEFDSLDLQEVQASTVKITTEKTDELLEKYKTFVESHKGAYINSDLMKMVFEVYARSPENRNKYNLAVTNSAACLANEYYTRAVSNPQIKRCVYIAGPYGAGKSFLAQSLFVAGAIPEDAIVYEGSITAPAFGKKVKLAIENGITPEILIINPTLELSMKNIKEREKTTGRGVIKSEVVEKYADMYPNIEKLFDYLREEFPELAKEQSPVSFQIYNKESNVPEDISISYNLEELKHGTRQEVSEQYDAIKKKLGDSEPKVDSDDLCL